MLCDGTLERRRPRWHSLLCDCNRRNFHGRPGFQLDALTSLRRLLSLLALPTLLLEDVLPVVAKYKDLRST